MIEWMQTHRKWLVITIWVATIAFIGAGFVGWGQFQFSKSQSTVAKVKDTEVTIQDWQEAYQSIFDEQNQKMGGNLDDKTAEKLGLKQKALEEAINFAILRQYAKDLGLTVTEKDIATKILQTFGNEKTYKNYLKNIGEKPANFEARLKKRLLVEKLLNFLEQNPTKTEILTIASALYNSDNLNIKVFDKRLIGVTLSEDEIKKYWQAHKNDFLTKQKYKIAYISIPLKGEFNEQDLKNYYNENKLNYKNEKGEIIPFDKAYEQVKKDYLAHKLKKEAIITYKKLKNNELNNYKLIEVEKDNKYIPTDKMQTLINEGYLKPFVYNNSYVIAQLVEEIKPMPKTYEEAKNDVIKVLKDKKATQELVKLAKNYNGKMQNLGFITKYDINKITNLTPIYATAFLFNVFISQKAKDFVLIPENNPQYAIVYNILAQKLLDKEKFEKNKKYITSLTKSLLNNEFLADLITELKNRYEIVRYVK